MAIYDFVEHGKVIKLFVRMLLRQSVDVYERRRGRAYLRHVRSTNV